MTIRPASIGDVNQIVGIHQSAFEGFFLTSLGPSFLTQYYSSFIKNRETVTLVAVEGTNVLGFSAATVLSQGFNSRLIKSDFIAYVWLGVKLLFSSPKSLIRLVKNFTKKSGEVQDDENYGELFSIGVRSGQQGKGIGKALLKDTELLIQAKGVNRLSLTTDYYNNEATLGFYHSMGYKVLYDFVAYPDRKMLRMIKLL